MTFDHEVYKKGESLSDNELENLGTGGNETGESKTNNEWPDPKPIKDALPPVDSLADIPGAIPGFLGEWLVDIATRMGCPLEYPAATAIVALSSVIGAQVVINPKSYDKGWGIVPNLWGGIVGPPGSMKSPAKRDAAAPLKALQDEAWATYELEHQEWAKENRHHVAKQKAYDDALKAYYRKLQDHENDSSKKHPGNQPKEPEQGPEEPKTRRYIVNDTTVEKLGVLLAENENGLLQDRDELSGFLAGLEREDRKQDRDF